MNATQSYSATQPPHPYMDGSHGHMTPTHGHTPTSGPPYGSYPQSSGVVHYSAYPHGTYPYGYGAPVSGPQPTHHAPPSYQPHPMSLPTMPTTQPSNNNPAHSGSNYPPHTMDTTGQVAPPNCKPKITGTVWEDEGTVCFQVEVGGICVARREDNCFINGTKLLNVANMTRGRRDGILKSEKIRNVTKIGPMHLKGVWIPFDRALEFANKEKITEKMYPLFLHNIGPMVGSAWGQNVTLPASTRRPSDGSPQYMRTPRTTQAPPAATIQPQSSMSNGVASQPSHSTAPQSAPSRPGLDRAHTFPTPPTSASAMGIAHSGNNYDWPNGSESHQGLQLNTGMNAKSLPTTPTTTPPDNTMPNVHYQPSQSYDSSRHVYSASQQSPYVSNQGMNQNVSYGHMQPPTRANGEDKISNGDERDYVHGYPDHNGYSYSDHSNVLPAVKDSPSHHPGSGRATPRAVNSQQQSQWDGYNSQQRSLLSSNLSHVMGDSRNTNGYTSTPPYSAQPTPSSKKRGRDADDEENTVADASVLKRRKNAQEGSAGLASISVNQPRTGLAQ